MQQSKSKLNDNGLTENAPDNALRKSSTTRQRRKVPVGRGLSIKLLVLTAIFVMMAEILIFPPSAANFRINWLKDKLDTAAVAGVILATSQASEHSQMMRDEILKVTDVYAIAIRANGVSRLLITSAMPPKIDEHINLDEKIGPFSAIYEAMKTVISHDAKILRVYGHVGNSKDQFEIIVSDHQLCVELLKYSRNIGLMSLFISLITAIMVFYSLHRVVIRPIRRLTLSMLNFADNPEDLAKVIKPSTRRDELGIAERELETMQCELQRTLGEKKRLADLGLAVSKINHDMRNILASAQLMSDRLATIKDPSVQSFAPKLIRTLDRAIDYTQSVLSYGKAQEPPAQKRQIKLHTIVEDVFSSLVPSDIANVTLKNSVVKDLEITGDSEQIFRILTNLCRNGVEAMNSSMNDASIINRLTIKAEKTCQNTLIHVIDTGPGLPKKARENLFTAFKGSARAGGTGLGLAIAQELARCHGGSIELVISRGGHTEFEITLPNQ